MAQTRHRSIARSVLATLMLFGITASGAGAQDRNAASRSLTWPREAAGRGQAGYPLHPALRRRGIASARTLGITQDNYGFMWFGTCRAYRYDGYSLKSYQHDPDNPNSLSETPSELSTKIGMAFSGSAATLAGSTAWTRLRTPSRITGMTPPTSGA